MGVHSLASDQHCMKTLGERLQRKLEGDWIMAVVGDDDHQASLKVSFPKLSILVDKRTDFGCSMGINM